MTRLALPLLAAGLLAASSLRAQAAGTDVSGATGACFGFSFGRFDPPLDWKGAGHRNPPMSAGPDAGESRDGGRRQWAADQTDSGRVEMVLFPAWWPVGVHVQLHEVGGDTLRGTATALVADGRVTPPVARVAALRVPCGERGARVVPPADDPPVPAAPAVPARPATPPSPRARRRPASTARSRAP